MRNKVNSLFSSVSYRIANTLLDPGDEWDAFVNVEKVLLTHAHFDHIYGLNRVIELNPSATVYTNLPGRDILLSDKKNLSRYHNSSFVFNYPEKIRIIENGETLQIGNDVLAEAHFTPGHNPSCITWVIGDAVFTGDSYIPGIKTVTNLPGADKTLAEYSEIRIKEMLHKRTVFPGHDITSLNINFSK